GPVALAALPLESADPSVWVRPTTTRFASSLLDRKSRLSRNRAHEFGIKNGGSHAERLPIELRSAMIEFPCKASGSRTPDDAEVPRFEPHPWCFGAHAQTIAGRYLNQSGQRLDSVNHDVEVDSGDRLRILTSVPPTWRNGD